MSLLKDVRILDLTNVLSGPFGTYLLALMGADVIKIEPPGSGDLARSLGADPALSKKKMGASFLAQNANKKSVTLNLKSPEGKAIFLRLARTADGVVENFRPGVMNRLGVGYDALRAVKPDILYLAVSGFGQDGPLAANPAYDQIIQGLSGVMAVNGTPEVNPLRCGFPACDTVGGLTAAFAFALGLYHRERTGEGQMIDVSLLDSMLPMLGWVVSNWLICNQAPVPMGNENFTAVPSGTFTTADGYLNIAANKQEQWEALADELGVPELKSHPHYKDRDSRKAHRYELNAVLNERLRTRSAAEWEVRLNALGVPSGAVLTLQQALEHPQVMHRELLQPVTAPSVGEIRVFGPAPKFSRTPGAVTAPPPELGEHTEAILAELGYDAAAVKALRDAGVV